MKDIKKLKVLVVDDSAPLRLVFKKVAFSLGWKVVGEAANGQEAVDLYKKLKPDLVTLDITMPVKDGVEALKEIIAEFPEAFIIMLTSRTLDSVKEDCMKNGAAGYIRKDLEIFKLMEIIKNTWESFETEGKEERN